MNSTDPNSVFKAKEKRDEVEGANEVQDSNDTKTELPIDQVAAEEVEEEDNLQEDIAPDNDDNDAKETKAEPEEPPKTPEVEEKIEPEEQVSAKKGGRKGRKKGGKQ